VVTCFLNSQINRFLNSPSLSRFTAGAAEIKYIQVNKRLRAVLFQDFQRVDGGDAAGQSAKFAVVMARERHNRSGNRSYRRQMARSVSQQDRSLQFESWKIDEKAISTFHPTRCLLRRSFVHLAKSRSSKRLCSGSESLIVGGIFGFLFFELEERG
jgi:hypothetical protein